MARYGYHSYEVGGMPMGHLPRRSPMGMDPNYRGGSYRGERFRDEPDRAPYGRYRADHRRELEDHGGARGRATGAGMLRSLPPSRPSGPAGPPQGRSTENLRGWRGDDAGGRPRGRDGGPGRYDRAYDRPYATGRSRPSGEPRPYGGSRGGRRPGSRGGDLDASRPLRYDGGMSRYGGHRGGGFSERFLGGARW